MKMGLFLGALLLCAPAMSAAQPMNLAAAFGAREGVTQASLSPDGSKIALVAPGPGQSTQVFVIDAVAGATPKRILVASGNPERISRCQWVAATRLACEIFGLQPYEGKIIGFSTIVAVDDTGANQKVISQRHGENALYWDLRGGGIIDLLPDEDGSVLMIRSYVPEAKIGSLVEHNAQGMGVDRVDTRTGAARKVESAQREAVEYITDGRGQVRVMGMSVANTEGYSKGRIRYLYRAKGSNDWRALSVLDYANRTGFNPYAVDSDKDVVYGFEPIGGRLALVTYSLDGALRRTAVLQRPDVDVDELVRIGRRHRVVGGGYTTEYTHYQYFDPSIETLQTSLARALGGNRTVGVIDTSVDEKRALVWAGSDTDPGQYYWFDRTAKRLSPVIPERPQLTGLTLAQVRPVSFPAGDGTMIPGYLTLPPGSNGKGLPAIVLPHGGPDARDYWGFDWLPQYFAARGFAVLQPNFRGSTGYGDAWFKKNGFQSWRTAIGDVADAGKWLIKQGIADPAKLTIFGWSYGGYAALQATVLEPNLFKAAVAVAPVTDLGTLTRGDSDQASYYVEKDFIGSGPHIREGSPAQNVDRIAVPILMFHGTMDANVPIAQSRMMDSRMHGAGKRSELVVFEGLDHQLEDSTARATMLQRAGDFLLAAGK